MPKNQEYIKMNNIELVLNTLYSQKELSRVELANATKLSTTSITRVTQFLIEKGYVREGESYSKGVGRNRVTLNVIAESAYSIGIAILKENLIFAVLDLNREVVFNYKEENNNSQMKIEDLAKYILKTLKRLLFENGISYEKVVGVGISVPGIVDNNQGIVNYSTQLKWENVNVKEIFSAIFEKSVEVENDTKARIVAKKTNKDLLNSECVVGLFIGDGVSAVGISEGFVVRGVNNAAGEVGHIVTQKDGEECDCGNLGCLQTKLARKFLLKRGRKHNNKISDVKEIITYYKNNEEWAIELIEDFKTSFLLILDILQHCYNPSLIIISGEMVDSFYEFLSKFIKEIELINKTTSTSIKLLISQNDISETSIGVGLLALQTMFN